jgi:hypothetical protein
LRSGGDILQETERTVLHESAQPRTAKKPRPIAFAAARTKAVARSNSLTSRKLRLDDVLKNDPQEVVKKDPEPPLVEINGTLAEGNQEAPQELAPGELENTLVAAEPEVAVSSSLLRTVQLEHVHSLVHVLLQSASLDTERWAAELERLASQAAHLLVPKSEAATVLLFLFKTAFYKID